MLRTVSEPAPLLQYLFSAWPEVKKKQVREWLKFNHVTVNGRATTQFDTALQPGDQVAIRSKAFTPADTLLPCGIRIRHEDESLLVVEKPGGLLTMASPSEDEQTAYAFLTDHVRNGNVKGRERVWIVHRLDRETSGLMVFAKSEEIKRRLQDKWEEAEKKYRAVVEGVPPSDKGTFTSDLDESDPHWVRSVRSSPTTRRAVTLYRVEKRGAGHTLVELTLETGRRHQIRVHLADAGCPIYGDTRYGAKTRMGKRIALHACSLRFTHPGTGGEMRFLSPLPGDIGRLVVEPRAPRV